MPSTGPSQSGLVAIGIATALTVISTCFVILRFWARSITKFGLWLDDWLALATLVTLYATLVISIVVVVYAGVGKPILQALEEDPYVITKVLKVWSGFLGTSDIASIDLDRSCCTPSNSSISSRLLS